MLGVASSSGDFLYQINPSSTLATVGGHYCSTVCPSISSFPHHRSLPETTGASTILPTYQRRVAHHEGPKEGPKSNLEPQPF